MRKNSRFLFLLIMSATIIFCLGHYSPSIKYYLCSVVKRVANLRITNWPEEFVIVSIPSTIDGSEQQSYFLSAPAESRQPLLVSLHAWSSDFSSFDPMAPMVKSAGWNYIHPDFRGPNWTTEACLSDKAISDIDDAIQYAIENGNVDVDNIYVVGASGGGYATLGMYLKSSHRVRAFLAWVPISDLSAWYFQTLNRDLMYSDDILKCTSDDMEVNLLQMRSRSPLFWRVPEKTESILEIYAGIDDGYTGSVPISHSILFYNHVARSSGNCPEIIDQNDVVMLLTRGVDKSGDLGHLGDRKILYKKGGEFLSIAIFEGGHEMLREYCFERVTMMVRQSTIME